MSERTKEDFLKLDTWLSKNSLKRVEELLELEFPLHEVYELVSSLISDKYNMFNATQKACPCCKQDCHDPDCGCIDLLDEEDE